MEVYEAITKRRSIRAFRDEAVPYDILEKCVNAARLAPSAMNRQLCEYVIVDDKQALARVLDSALMWAGVPKPEGGWSPQGRPKAYIVSLINTELAAEIGCGSRNTDFDAALAMENMVLAAEGEGLGSCIMTGIDKERLRRALNIPDRYEIAMLLALGYPSEKAVTEDSEGAVERWLDAEGVRHVPKRKLKDIIHRNIFSA